MVQRLLIAGTYPFMTGGRTDGTKAQGERVLAIDGLVAFDAVFRNSDQLLRLEQHGEHQEQDSVQGLHFISKGLRPGRRPGTWSDEQNLDLDTDNLRSPLLRCLLVLGGFLQGAGFH
jgi:hypothetical protein